MHPRFVFGAIALIAAVVGCNGTSYVLPRSAVAPQNATASSPHKKAGCSAPIENVPGTYTHFTSFGTLKGSRYKGEVNALVSNWVRADYVATTGPSPTASASPPAKSYEYYGTFKLKKGGEGCAYFITAVGGKPEFGQFNAGALGLPHFKILATPSKMLASGETVLVLTGLSASGGRGTVTLKTLSGKIYDSGPVTLVGRLVVP